MTFRWIHLLLAISLGFAPVVAIWVFDVVPPQVASCREAGGVYVKFYCHFQK